MFLTITTTHNPATDIGYLLHKNPGKLHEVSLSFGQAYVFYPEATAERCTAALLLDVDPVGLPSNGALVRWRSRLAEKQFMFRGHQLVRAMRPDCAEG